MCIAKLDHHLPPRPGTRSKHNKDTKRSGNSIQEKGIVLKLGYSPLCKNNIVTRMPKPSAPAVKLSAEPGKIEIKTSPGQLYYLAD